MQEGPDAQERCRLASLQQLEANQVSGDEKRLDANRGIQEVAKRRAKNLKDQIGAR